MSDTKLHDEAKASLKHALLNQCTDDQRDLFLRRFAPGVTDIELLIDDMPVEQLPWAIAQLTNMLKGNDE